MQDLFDGGGALEASSAVSSTLAGEGTVIVKQAKSWTEVFTDLETVSRFSVSTPDGRELWAAAEISQGFLGVIARWFLKSARPFTMELRARDGSVAMRIQRPWRFFFSHVDVFTGDGAPLGEVQERWGWFTRLYELKDPSGNVLASLVGPLFRPWTFLVKIDGKEVAQISKKWSGLGREMFTDADTYGLTFQGTTPGVRALMLAATFLIDFRHFEHKD